MTFISREASMIITELQSMLLRVFELKREKLPPEILGALTESIKIYTELDAIDKYINDADQFYEDTRKASVLARQVADYLSRDTDEEVQSLALKISNTAYTLLDLKKIPDEPKSYLLAMINDQKILSDRLRKAIGEAEARTTQLEIKIDDIQAKADEEINKITQTYSETVHELNQKKKEIQKLVGFVAGTAIEDGYQKSARRERIAAEILRILSIVCMLLVIGTLVYTSSLMATDPTTHWSNLAIKVVIAILISVPAAYLARESSKHREQEHQHLRYALDLKAISPFLDKLPEFEQHKIKKELASKLFGARPITDSNESSYPVNLHEVIMALIKKLEIKK